MDALAARLPISKLREWLAWFQLEEDDATDRRLQAESDSLASAHRRRR